MTEVVSANSYFWKEVKKNPLKGVVYIHKTTQLYIRLFGLVVTTVATVWSAIYAIELMELYLLFAYMTIWGVWACNAYFILLFFSVDAPNDSKLWKVTYMVGEIAACM